MKDEKSVWSIGLRMVKRMAREFKNEEKAVPELKGLKLQSV